MFLEDTNIDDTVALDEAATAALTEVAVQLGLLVTTEEAAALDTLFSSEDAALTEAAKNIVRLNRQAKLDSLVVRSAIVIGRSKKDPDFVKYAKFAQLKRQYRDKLVRKYQSPARSTARRLLANAGKTMVDVSSTKAFGNPANRV